MRSLLPSLFWFMPALLFAAGFGGCGAGDGVARVTLTSNAPIAGVSVIRATATVGGVMAAQNEFDQAVPITISSGSQRAFGLRFDKGHTGDLVVQVVVLDGNGGMLGSGSGSGHVDASKEADVTVVLAPGAPPLCVFSDVAQSRNLFSDKPRITCVFAP